MQPHSHPPPGPSFAPWRPTQGRCLCAADTTVSLWHICPPGLGYVSCRGRSLQVAPSCILLSLLSWRALQTPPLRSPSVGSPTTDAGGFCVWSGREPGTRRPQNSRGALQPATLLLDRSRSQSNIYKINLKFNSAFRRKSSQWHSFEIPSDLCWYI